MQILALPLNPTHKFAPNLPRTLLGGKSTAHGAFCPLPLFCDEGRNRCLRITIQFCSPCVATHVFLLVHLLERAGVDDVPLQFLDLVGLLPAEQLDDFLSHIGAVVDPGAVFATRVEHFPLSPRKFT